MYANELRKMKKKGKTIRKKGKLHLSPYSTLRLTTTYRTTSNSMTFTSHIQMPSCPLPRLPLTNHVLPTVLDRTVPSLPQS